MRQKETIISRLSTDLSNKEHKKVLVLCQSWEMSEKCSEKQGEIFYKEKYYQIMQLWGDIQYRLNDTDLKNKTKETIRILHRLKINNKAMVAHKRQTNYYIEDKRKNKCNNYFGINFKRETNNDSLRKTHTYTQSGKGSE